MTETSRQVTAEDLSKHTPGPWKAELHFGRWTVRQDPTDWDGMGFQSIGLVGRFHADRKGTHYGDMFKANALLISAAPDLLAVVRGISTMDCFWSASGHHEADCQCMVGQAERAIAKAEGR